MKKLLILSSVVASLTATSALAKTEGRYAGIDLIRGNVSFAEQYTNDSNVTPVQTSPSTDGSGVGVGLSYGYAKNFDGLFVAPGIFVEQNNTESSAAVQRLSVENRYGVKADIGYDIASNIAPYFTVGYSRLAYKSRNQAANTTNSAIKNGVTGGWFYGVGLKLDVNEKWAFKVEYQTQDFRAKTRTDGTANYSGVFKSNYNEIKLGAAYKF